MNLKETVSNLFTKDNDKGGRAIESKAWEKAMMTGWGDPGLERARIKYEAQQAQAAYEARKQMEQMAQQAYNTMTITTTTGTTTGTGNALGNANTSGLSGLVYTQFPPEPIFPDHRQQIVLQVINLIANFGPTVSKRICAKFHLQITPEEVDEIHKDLTRIIANVDESMDKVIDEVVKEVKI